MTHELPRAGIGRITAAAVAIAAMLPYLTLKGIWLSGHPTGISDPAMMSSPTMVGLNAATFAMDAVALVLALAFSMRWGMRLPAWLVLLPIWVGTGLLGTIAVTVPLTMLVAGTSAFPVDGMIAQWVYLAVYMGFIGQGIGLATAFALYARDRWPALFTTPLSYGVANVTRPLQRLAARGVLLFTVCIGGTWLYWAFGGDAGLAPELAARRTLSSGLQQGFKGLLAVAAAVALLVIVRGRSSRPFWQPLVVAWLGAGSMFAWGLYDMVMTVLKPPLMAGITFSTALPDLLSLFALLTGLVMGLAGAFLLVERSGGGGVQPAQDPAEGEERDDDRQTADHGHR